MADVQNIITLGIGSSPGSIVPFVLFGLDVSPVTDVGIPLSLEPRSMAWTLEGRALDWSLKKRDLDWKVEGDPR